MEKQPDEIISVTLDCILMPNGEVIHHGRTVAWFKESKGFLTPVADAQGNPIIEEARK